MTRRWSAPVHPAHELKSPPVLAPRLRRHKAGRESYDMGTGTIGNGVRGKTLTCGLNLRTVAL